MPHLVPAAKKLMAQVLDLDPKAKVVVLSDADGLGFQRSIRIEGAAGKRLAPALEAMKDPRIAEVIKSSKGTRVRFVPTTRADHAHPFPLAEVLAVLED